MNNSSDYIIIILGQNQTYGHEMTAVFSPLRRTFKSQYPSGNSRRHAGFGPASYTQEDMPMGTTDPRRGPRDRAPDRTEEL